MILYEHGFLGLGTLNRIDGSAAYKVIIPSLVSTGILFGYHHQRLVQYGEERFVLHPYAIGALIAFFSFLLTFRLNFAYGRYWEGATSIHSMLSKWLDCGMMMAAFHYQSSQYNDIEPPTFAKSISQRFPNGLLPSTHQIIGRDRDYRGPESYEETAVAIQQIAVVEQQQHHHQQEVSPQTTHDEHKHSLVTSRFFQTLLKHRHHKKLKQQRKKQQQQQQFEGKKKLKHSRSLVDLQQLDSSIHAKSICDSTSFDYNSNKKKMTYSSSFVDLQRIDSSFHGKKFRDNMMEGNQKKLTHSRSLVDQQQIDASIHAKSIRDSTTVNRRIIQNENNEVEAVNGTTNSRHHHSIPVPPRFRKNPSRTSSGVSNIRSGADEKGDEFSVISIASNDDITVITDAKSNLHPAMSDCRSVGSDGATRQTLLPSLFLQETAHLLSLLSAVALSTLRNDIECAESPITEYYVGQPWPEVDSYFLDPETRASYGERTIVISIIYFLFGISRSPKHRTMYNAARPLGVLGGVSDEEIRLLQLARGPYAKVALVTMWLQEYISREYLHGSTGTVAAPIISRIYALVSDGAVAYNQAKKIAYVPFPFPTAQIASFFSLAIIFIFPLLYDEYVNRHWFAAVMNFTTVLCFLGLHEVARELENPFINVPNDLPLTTFQAQFNEALVTMYAGYHPDSWWEVVPIQDTVVPDDKNIFDSKVNERDLYCAVPTDITTPTPSASAVPDSADPTASLEQLIDASIEI